MWLPLAAAATAFQRLNAQSSNIYRSVVCNRIDDGLIPKQHICHLGDTVRNPNSSCVIIKLYGTSARGCNNNAGIQKNNNSTFPTVDVSRTSGSGQASRRRQIGNAECNVLLCLIFRSCTTTVLNVMIIIVKVVQWCSM